MHRSWLIARLLLLLAIVSGAAHADGRGKLDVYLAAAAHEAAPAARGALPRIEERPRRLLALRSYLRAGEGLSARWSWSAERIEAFTRTTEHRELVAAVERVRDTFEQQNPGYTLYANTETRSLDVQLERWNENAGVSRVAQQLERAVLAELNGSAYSPTPTPADVERFVAFLRNWRPTSPAPLAAPGLSLHGQSRAIDFQIMKGERVVAATDVGSVRSVWERQGWSAKLQRAVDQAEFVGPLKSPNEPWHYEYVGGVARTASRSGDGAR